MVRGEQIPTPRGAHRVLKVFKQGSGGTGPSGVQGQRPGGGVRGGSAPRIFFGVFKAKNWSESVFLL